MAELSVLFVPVILGFLLLIIFIQITIFWQMERSWRVFSFFVMYVGLFWLYVVFALDAHILWRNIGRVIFILGLLGGVWFRGGELIAFMKAKALKKIVVNASKPVTPLTKTLQQLSVDNTSVKLDATEKTVVESVESLEKEQI